MRLIFLTLLMLLPHLTTHSAERPDILGGDFTAESLDMGFDYSGSVRSTLVRLNPIVPHSRAILYIHGFNDYFFQSDMAHRFQDAGYNFYAIDLRRYGRSLSALDNPFEVRDLAEYFEDIEVAINTIRLEGGDDITLMGHSTGGLIAAYYVGVNEDNPPVERLILNSPYLDQNVGWALKHLALPIVAAVGKLLPDLEVLNDSSTLYYDSLHRESHGEWSYDTSLKMPQSPPITAGWLRAIYTAQQSVQQGYSLDTPILLMYSDKSLITDHWQDEIMCSDIVLNVKDIAKYGSNLSCDVTHAEIKDGIHDLILSPIEAREAAYSAIFSWLERQ